MTPSLDLETQVIAALRRISRAIDLHSRMLLKTCGLTSPQLTALHAVRRMQPVTVGALAREIHLGQATVTGILSRLESRGLVMRTRGSQDRRSVLVELTETGADLVSEAPSPLQERFHQALSRLEEWERTMILATLQRIATMMDAEQIEAVPMLASGTAGANEEDLSRYLERAVMPSEETPPTDAPPETEPRFGLSGSQQDQGGCAVPPKG
ncbi:MAG: MarR family transcriptional regulator [Pirellulales bacterium]|nr:MarR family transcriptional regulator [Pirellulales bacterium]